LFQSPPFTSQLSDNAYNDFLKGLDLINQQEYVYEKFAKKEKIRPDQINEFFHEVEPKPDATCTWYNRAVWERQVVKKKFQT
jgi:hypothetical protein